MSRLCEKRSPGAGSFSQGQPHRAQTSGWLLIGYWVPRPPAGPRRYIKEDLIIPNHLSFYDLIVTKARGKSGPLFHFDVLLRVRSCVRRSSAAIRFRCTHSSARGRLARPFVRRSRGCTHARRGAAD